MIDIVINGLISGLIYSFIASGFSLTYGVSGVVNLTYGAFFMIGAYLFGNLYKILAYNIPSEFSYLVPILALLIATIITGIIGGIYYRLTLHQVLGDEVTTLIISLFGCIIFQQIIYLIPTIGPVWAAQYPIPTLLPGTLTFWNVTIEVDRASAAATSLICFLGLWIFTAKTRVGKVMRALSQDLEAAMLMGANVGKIYILVAGIAAGLACMASVLKISAYAEPANVVMWVEYMAYSFSIVILGGLGSLKGTLVGGFIFGYAYAIVEKYFPRAGALMPIAPFVIIIIMLVLRPKGLFGKRIEME
ncbi:MAG: branched-chain amino acid ABC transporter permease [Nitrososphaerota archaeon]